MSKSNIGRNDENVSIGNMKAIKIKKREGRYKKKYIPIPCNNPRVYSDYLADVTFNAKAVCYYLKPTKEQYREKSRANKRYVLHAIEYDKPYNLFDSPYYFSNVLNWD